ncbi:cebp-2 [Pristionchus pacificus]|uniref:Cebp-2 n=1 Tax=Pristionchus pacificus TaxID=54126 RepID=A0A2A6BGR3_PRIPA|nr:cebp-2 [Pristionchus pacificus]|eukprot:PDM65070.1 cebp-2 [Pristionchus pacificus]
MSARKRKSDQAAADAAAAAAQQAADDYLALSEMGGEDQDYRVKRARNNEAVNRTRQKKKQEEVDTSLKVETLRVENSALERKVESLQKELSFLKEMFMAYAKKENGTGPSQQQPPIGGAPGPSSTNPFSSL